MSKFYRPSGASTQLRGVASDIVLPSPSDLGDVNESSLKDPLPWDAVPAAPHEQLNRVQPFVSTLRERSLHRIKTDKPFTDLAEDVARLKQSLAEKSVSLNEVERRQELAQLKARQDERKQEELTHPIARPTSYEITLKNASLPGLPTPTAAANPSSDNDILLHETMKILGDYADLLGIQPKVPRLAGPQVGPVPAGSHRP
jgi:carboxyl-terminal processing protease